MLPETHRGRGVNTLNVLNICVKPCNIRCYNITGTSVIFSFLPLQIYMKVAELGKNPTFSNVLSSNCNVELLLK